MDMRSNRYRNLADWSHEEWEVLDIHLFIAVNFTRYCTTLLKKVGLQYLPSDASDSLLGLFCDVAYKPLKTVHLRNLAVSGERRNQVMLGTLKMITFTRMVEALIREFPNYIALEQLPEFVDEDLLYHSDDEETPSSMYWQLPTSEPGQQAFYAAETAGFAFNLVEHEDDGEDERVSKMIEMLRAHLTPIQYRHIRLAICEGLNSQEIADITGASATNVRIMLLNARKKMLALVPPHLLGSMQDCLHRR